MHHRGLLVVDVRLRIVVRAAKVVWSGLRACDHHFGLGSFDHSILLSGCGGSTRPGTFSLDRLTGLLRSLSGNLLSAVSMTDKARLENTLEIVPKPRHGAVFRIEPVQQPSIRTFNERVCDRSMIRCFEISDLACLEKKCKGSGHQLDKLAATLGETNQVLYFGPTSS